MIYALIGVTLLTIFTFASFSINSKIKKPESNKISCNSCAIKNCALKGENNVD